MKERVNELVVNGFKILWCVKEELKIYVIDWEKIFI